MVNQVLLDRFLGMFEGKRIVECGLHKKTLMILKQKYEVETFDPGMSTFAMVPMGFRASGMMHIPYNNGDFDGALMVNTMDKVGDRDFFIKEVFRITRGPVVFLEPAIEFFPITALADNEDIFVNVASIDGRLVELNQTWHELISRMDFRKIFTLPGGRLNKFNQLTPEDVKVEIGVICTIN